MGSTHPLTEASTFTDLLHVIIHKKCGGVCHAMGCLQLDAVTARQAPLEVILLFVVFVGLCDGLAQGAIFGDVALLPPKYTQVLHPSSASILTILYYLIVIMHVQHLS